jgi:hypothetical protein
MGAMMLRPAGRVEDLTREMATQRPDEGFAAALDGRRRRAAELLAAQYRRTGPWAHGAAETRDEPVTRERMQAEARRARAIVDQAGAPRPASTRRRAPPSTGAEWQRPVPQSGPLTAADRAFLLVQYDRERAAARQRRERMRRTAAQMRR